MDHAINAPSGRLPEDTLPLNLGLVAGFVLPMVAAAVFPTYSIAVGNPSLESARQLGYPWTLAELCLVLFAIRRGYSIRSAWTRLSTPVQLAAALFLATFWLSSAFLSLHPGFSLQLTVGWSIHLLFLSALTHLFAARETVRLHDLWYGFALGMPALAVAIAVHFLWLPPGLSGLEHQIDWGTAIPGFISVRLFGAWAGAVLTFLIGVAWLDGSGKMPDRYLHWAISLAFGMMFWSGTRAAVVGSLLMLPIARCIGGRPRRRGLAWALMPRLAVAAILAILLQPYHDPAFSFLTDWLDPNLRTTPDTLTSGRLTLWRNALGVARHHLLLGTGAGSSWWLVALDGQRHVQPHNMIVQFLLNWGLVPTIPALLLIARALWVAHRAGWVDKNLLPFILVIDLLLFMALFDGMFHFSQFLMILSGCLAVCLARARHGECGRATDLPIPDGQTDNSDRAHTENHGPPIGAVRPRREPAVTIAPDRDLPARRRIV